jgi:KaiC/GvpD/RAD55 family RecA-like ATPase
VFKKATKTQSKLRMALYGVSGSGKTYSALAIAKGLGGKVALIDTERGSASKYADLYDFDVLDMQPPYSPARYAEAIKAAEKEGYDILIIDSLTHAWSGEGGALQMVDNAAKRSSSGNSYTAWRDVTPEHNRLIDAILQSTCHIIATMRSKAEYVLEEDSRGKKVPRKKAMAPIQRDGMEYEFDVVAEMDTDNNMIVQKTRCPALSGQVFAKPNGAVSDALKAWLVSGAPPATATTEPPSATPATERTATAGKAAIMAQAERAKQLVQALSNAGMDIGALEGAISDARKVYGDKQASIGALYDAASELHSACDKADAMLADPA